MLPVPNLDDRLYEEIVADARRMIPKIMPLWTDENAHDPGITFLELFAWLTEMQQYYLNRITVKNELSFLKLLGVHLQQRTSAHTDVTFGGVEQQLLLPEGTKLLAEEMPFETKDSIWLLPGKVDRVLVGAEAETFDFTAANENVKTGYYAFGADAREGNRLLIAFDQELPAELPITLTCTMFDQYAVAFALPEQGDLQIVPSARIAWEYFGLPEGKEAPSWQPLHLLADETFQFTRSGRITVRLNGKMSLTTVHPAKDRPRYWISCTVQQAGFELAPKIENISLNTIEAVQRDSHSAVIAFDGTGEPGQTLAAFHYLACSGQVIVQVQESDGIWREWDVVADFSKSDADSLHCLVQRTQGSTETVLQFGDGTHGKIPPSGKQNIRLIAHSAVFAAHRCIGKSNGLPNQRFELMRGTHIESSMRLQVKVLIPGSKQYRWQDWTRVDSLEYSGGEDWHFVYDEETNEICFGDNERGEIPSACTDPDTDGNIYLIGLQSGGGERGNVKEQMIRTLLASPDLLPPLAVTNYFAAKGGAEKETLAAAKQRARRELKKPTRAVTCDDYEAIARATPGLRVARVKAIPLYAPGTRGYPQQKVPAQATVVVVPYSEAEKPMPSQGFLDTVKQHVDQHRLLTTELHVIPPEYVQITVNAIVVVDPLAKDLADKIVKALRQFLQPLDPTNAGGGWEFGRTVYKGDVFGVINQLSGVEYIQDLWFDAEGNGIHKDSSGDIQLPPHGLVYSGEHQIEVVSLTDV